MGKNDHPLTNPQNTHTHMRKEKLENFTSEAVANHFEIVKGDVPVSIWFQQFELCSEIGQFILCQGF